MNRRILGISTVVVISGALAVFAAVRLTASEPTETVNSGTLVVDGKVGEKTWVTVTLTVRAESLGHESASEFTGWGTFFIDGMADDGRVDVSGYPGKDCDFTSCWSDGGGKHEGSESGDTYTLEITKEISGGSRMPFTIKSSIASACGCSVSQGHLTVEMDVSGARVE